MTMLLLGFHSIPLLRVICCDFILQIRLPIVHNQRGAHLNLSEKKAVVFAMYLSYRKASGGQPQEVPDRNPVGQPHEWPQIYIHTSRWIIWRYLDSAIPLLVIQTIRRFEVVHGTSWSWVTQVGCSFPNEVGLFVGSSTYTTGSAPGAPKSREHPPSLPSTTWKNWSILKGYFERHPLKSYPNWIISYQLRSWNVHQKDSNVAPIFHQPAVGK